MGFNCLYATEHSTYYKLHSVKFYKRLYLKSGLLHDIFWSFMIFNCDDCMMTVFIPLHKAVSNLLSQFHDYVSGKAWYCMMCLSVYICISLSVSAWLANECVQNGHGWYYEFSNELRMISRRVAADRNLKIHTPLAADRLPTSGDNTKSLGTAAAWSGYPVRLYKCHSAHSRWIAGAFRHDTRRPSCSAPYRPSA